MKHKKNPAAVSLGRLGGLAGTGKAKARTAGQARAAANARWEKARANNRGQTMAPYAPTQGEPS